MSQAVIDFCEGLKTTLLALEDKLDRAKHNLETGAAHASGEAKKQVEEAAEQLAAFRAQAALTAKAIRADLPEQTSALQEKLRDFGQEAQVAMRHAVVFLAEGAAGALQAGAKQAHQVAEGLRHDTAVTVVEPDQTTPPA